MPTEFAYDVFLSHKSDDKPRVRKLAERLKAAGVRVWLDEWIIKPGDDIYLAIEHGLQASRVQVLCLSQAALGSDWVALERSTVVFRDPTNKGRRFIPLLLSECELPDTLRRYKYVDFRAESDAAFAEVLASCRPGRESAPSAPQSKGQKKPPAKKPKPAEPQETEPLALLERKLHGHKNWVHSVAVSPDGTWLASGSDDKTVKIWDLATGECRATLGGQSIVSRAVAITSNGKRILVGSNAIIYAWNSNTFELEFKNTVNLRIVLAVCDVPGTNSVLCGGARNEGGLTNLQRWNIVSGRSEWSSREHENTVTSIRTFKYNNMAISCSFDKSIRIWNIKSGECLAALKGHSKRVISVQLMPDERFAVSGSEDKTIKIWNLEAGTCVGTLEGHQRGVDSIAISPDGTLIASTGFTDQTVRLWDWKSGACLQVITTEARWTPLSLAFTPDGSQFVVGTAQGPIYVYCLTGTRPKPSAEATRRYVNAKVVLLGEGTVGKTSLAHRLIEDKYVVKDRTHGMNVWRMELPLPPDATLEREALLWDLAGQEDYRLIHQLFLDQTALALLLINPQKDDPFAEAGDWLKALKMAANNHETKREAIRLLVFSQVDVGRMKLGKMKIDRFCEQYGFTEWIATSAKTGENCSDKKNKNKPSRLKELLATHIPWDKLPWTSTPRLLAEIKKAVMAMRDESDIRLLRFSELAQRLEQSLPGEKFGEPEVRTAVTLLANHGLARPLKFGDLVLLRPDLINGYAGAVIRAARSHSDEIGCVLEADIYKPEFDFTGVERLKHRPDEELLLRALVQTFLNHSLCIAEDTPQGRHLVFPSQYRREKDLPHEPDIFVSYTFSGEWQTVWTTLVVRLWYSQEFKHRELWRNAAEFESAKKQMLGLKIAKVWDGAATISLYFDAKLPDELKVIFIEYAHRHLERYATDVKRDRRYICQCGKPITDLDAVRRRIEAKKDFITCQDCDEPVPFIDFIEQRLKSDPVAQRILVMEATATRELDAQALEQILIGHMMATAGEANQIFRPVTMFDYGIDGEVEFKDNDGKPSGKKIYIQLKSGNSYLRTRQGDGKEVFDVKNDRHLTYWISQPVDVYLVIRQTDERSSEGTIRWMNVTRYLKKRKDKTSKQIIFDGEKLDMEAMWKVRDQFFPPGGARR